MAGISVGSVSVSVVPDLSGFTRTLRAQAVSQAGQIGEDIGRQIGEGIRRGLGRESPFEPVREEQERQRRRAPRDGEQQAGAFARGFERRLRSAFEALPRVEVDADSTPAQRRIAELRARMEALSEKTIGVDIDADEAVRQMELLQAELRLLGDADVDFTVRADVAAALAQMAALQREVEKVDGQHVEVEVDVDTDRGVAGVTRLTAGIGGLVKAVSPGKFIAPMASAGLAVGAVAGTAVSAAVALAPAAGALLSLGQAAVAAAPALLAMRVAGKIVELSLTAIFKKGSAARNALIPLKEAFDEAAVAGSRAAAQGVKPLAEELAQVASPTVTQFMKEIGESANIVQIEFLEWARSADGVGTIKDILLPISASMKTLAPQISATAVSFARMLGRIMDVSTAVGTRGLTGILINLRERFDRINASTVQGGMDKLWRTFVTVRNVASTLVGWIQKIVTAYKTYTTQFRAVADAVSVAAIIFGGPVTAVIGAVGLIIRHFDQLKAAYQSVKAAFSSPTAGGVFADFKSFAKDVLPAVKTAFTQVKAIVLPVLQSIWEKISKNLVPAFSGLVRALGPVVAWFIRILGPAVARTFANIMRIIGGAIDIISGIFKVFTAILTGDWGKAWDGIKDIVGGTLGIVGGVVRQFWNLVSTQFRLGAGVIMAVLQFAWGIVRPIFTGIGAAIQAVGRFAVWLWNVAIGPAFRGIAAAATWLWNNAIGPAFRGIAAVVQFAWTIIRPILTGIWTAIQTVGRIVSWVWTTVIGPAFRGITAVIQFAWGIIRPIFNAIATVIRTVLGVAFFVLSTQVRVAWAVVQGAIRVAWAIIRPIFNAIASVIRTVLSIAFVVFRNLAKAVWIAIQVAIRLAWAVIRGIFAAIRAYINTVLAPVFRWLLNTIIRPVWTGIRTAINVAWLAIRLIWAAVRGYINNTLAPAFRTFRTTVSTVWNAIKSTISSVYNGGIKPVFDRLKSAVATVRAAFSTAVNGIKAAWDRLRGIAKAPVNFVIGIYNRGIVNLVNKLADFAGIKTRLSAIPALAHGGVLPGYKPGKDTLLAAVSPGEAVMRPEWTRAVGAGFVNQANVVARRSGPQGVRKWMTGNKPLRGEGLAYAQGGVVPGFAGSFQLGGIIDSFVKGVKDFTIGNVEKGARTLLDKVFAAAVPGSGLFRDLVAAVPNWIKTKLLGWIKAKISSGGVIGGKGFANALAWARTQDGKPYQWGGGGNPSWDCSGFMAGIVNVIKGKRPGRLFTTMDFTGSQNGPSGFVRNARSGFMVGVYNGPSASQSHMAGTLNGVAVESSGSNGVQVGPPARGYNNGMFSLHYGLKAANGGVVGVRTASYDRGGMLQPGYTLAYNGTGRPEPVVSSFARGGVVGYARGGVTRAARTKTGTDLLKAVGSGMWRDTAKATAWINNLNTAIKKTFSGSVEKRLLTWSAGIQKAMGAAASKAAAIAAQINAAKEYAASVTSSAQEYASLQNLPVRGTAADVVTGLTDRARDLAGFGSQIAELRSRGLAKGLLSQVIGMGVGEGSKLAGTLLSAESGVFAQLNVAQTAIDKASAGLGRTAADAMYDSGKNASKGFLAGLLGQQASLNTYMDSLGKRLAAGVRLAFKSGKPGSIKIVKYDNGGFLPTGHSLVYNGTGRPEPVLTGDQFTTLASHGRGTDDAAAGARIEQHFHELPFTPSQMAREAAREAAWELRG